MREILSSVMGLEFLHGIMLCVFLTIISIVIHLSVTNTVHAESTDQSEPVNSYAQWENGPPSDPGYFPIAVWLQQPKNAAKYKAAGINLYVGLWKGPTEEQLAELTEAGMQVICSQNKVAMAHKDDPIIVGWMHGDEPDNAQAIIDPETGKRSYGGPVPPPSIVEDYEKYRARRANASHHAEPGSGRRQRRMAWTRQWSAYRRLPNLCQRL